MSRQIINNQYRFDWLPTQKAALMAIYGMQYDNTLFSGGYGNGKSVFLGETALSLSYDFNGIEFLFWRKTRAAIKATTYRLFLEKVIPPEYIYSHNKSDLSIVDIYGSRYDFLGLDKITRKGSYWGDMALLDECVEFTEAEFRLIEGRLRAKRLPRSQTVGTTNPGAPGSFWHTDFVVPETRKKNNSFFTASSFENIHNPAFFFERLEKWKGTQYYDRYVLGKWTTFAGNVWDTFDPQIQIVEPFEIPKVWRRVIAIDWGYDAPLVMLWMARDPLHKRWVCYRQFYKTKTLVRDAAKIGKGICGKAWEEIDAIWTDHEAEQRAQFEEDWRETFPANKEVGMGIQTVQEYMFTQADGLPGLLIFDNSWSDKEGFWYGLIEQDLELLEKKQPTCLQEEIPNYKWGKNDKPIKEADHGCDALRYCCHSEEEEKHGKISGIQVVKGDSFARE